MQEHGGGGRLGLGVAATPGPAIGKPGRHFGTAGPKQALSRKACRAGAIRDLRSDAYWGLAVRNRKLAVQRWIGAGDRATESESEQGIDRLRGHRSWESAIWGLTRVAIDIQADAGTLQAERGSAPVIDRPMQASRGIQRAE